MKYIKLDVTNHKDLLKLGYNEKTYYCGLKKFENVATDVYAKLKYWGVTLPFNPACFKHDVLYGELFIVSKFNLPKKLGRKFLIDAVFYNDMCKLIKKKDCNKATKKMLKNIARLYYFLVTFGTVGYLIYKAYKKIKGWIK